MENIWIIAVIVLIILIAYLVGRLQGRTRTDIPTDVVDLYKGLHDLPSRVLQTIQGSINPQKGKMAELLTYAELRYSYDRIIPLGFPIDFIGIKNGERIDFIEVKSSSSSPLTAEEKHIKNLITEGRINFKIIRVNEEEIHSFVSARRRE